MLARHQLADHDRRGLSPHPSRSRQRYERTYDKSPDTNGWISHWRGSCADSLDQLPGMTAREAATCAGAWVTIVRLQRVQDTGLR